MNENTQDQNSQKSVSDLTPALVRRRIAHHIYTTELDVTWRGENCMRLVKPSKEQPQGWIISTIMLPWRDGDPLEALITHGMNTGAIPDWPTDTGAALALCLEIARTHLLTLDIDSDEVGTRVLFRPKPHIYIVRYSATGATPAESLARLALRALEGGAG